MEAPDRQLPEADDDGVPVVNFIGLRRPEPVPISSFPAASVREAPAYQAKVSKNPMEAERLKNEGRSAIQVSEVPMDEATLKAKLEDFNSNYRDKKYDRLGKKLEESNAARNHAKDQVKFSPDPVKEDRQPKVSRSTNIVDEEMESPQPRMSGLNPQSYSQTLTQFAVVFVAVFILMYPTAFITCALGCAVGYLVRHLGLFSVGGIDELISQVTHLKLAQSSIPVVVSAPDESPDFYSDQTPTDYNSPLKPAVSTRNARNPSEKDALAARAVLNEYLEDNELSVPERIHLMRMFKQTGINAEVGMTADQMYDLPEDGSGFPMTNNRTAEEVRVVFAKSETDTELFAAIQSGAELMEVSPDEFVNECYAGSVDATIARILSPIKNPADAVNAEQLDAMGSSWDDNATVNVEAAMAEHIKRISNKDSFARAVEAVRNDEKFLEVQRMSLKPDPSTAKPHLKINTRSAPKERVRAANVAGGNTEDLNAHNTTHRVVSLYSSRVNPFLNNAIEVHLVSGNYKSVIDIIESHYIGDVGSTVAQIIENAKRLVAQTQASIKAMSLRAAALKAVDPVPDLKTVAPSAEVKTSP